MYDLLVDKSDVKTGPQIRRLASKYSRPTHSLGLCGRLLLTQI